MARVAEDLTLKHVRVIFVELSQEDLEVAKEEGATLASNVRNAWEYDEDLTVKWTECGDFIGSVEDHMVATVLTKLLRKLLKAPFLDCVANEEPGYGLPEFSVYLNWDARSWCGRWMYSEVYEEWMDLIFALTPSEIRDLEAHRGRIEEWLSQENRAVAVLINRMINP